MNMFQLAIAIFNNWAKIQRVIALLTPIVREYNKNSRELTQLVNELAEAFVPSGGQIVTQAVTHTDYNVKELQANLKKVGFKLDVDGQYGSDTTEAVRSFQQRQGLTADGWYGVETAAKMMEALKHVGKA